MNEGLHNEGFYKKFLQNRFSPVICRPDLPGGSHPPRETTNNPISLNLCPLIFSPLDNDSLSKRKGSNFFNMNFQ